MNHLFLSFSSIDWHGSTRPPCAPCLAAIACRPLRRADGRSGPLTYDLDGILMEHVYIIYRVVYAEQLLYLCPIRITHH